MDPRQFDKLSKTLATGFSRRAAVRGAGGGLAAGLFGGLGWRRALAAPSDSAICDLDFVATVRIGSSSQHKSTKVIKGELGLRFGKDGVIDEAELVGADGRPFVVVGQATGRAISLWIDLADGAPLVALGASEKAITQCAGSMRGTFSGPKDGDLGDWVASPKKSGAADTVTPTAAASAAQPTEISAPPAETTSDGSSSQCPLVCSGGAIGVDEATCSCNCPAGQTSCVSGDIGVCADVTGDSANCGACFNACPSPAPNAIVACVNSQCTQQCLTGFDDCTPGACTADVCINVQDSDLQNCGGCGEACPTGAIACENGLCACQTCPTGYSVAPGTCTCVCGAGLTECNGDQCVDLMTDHMNCGACGNSCRTAANCEGGQCVCQNACGPSFTLNPATCTCECAEGLVECGGVCQDLTSDPSNCGACGRHCPSKFPDCSDGGCAALNP